MTPLRQRLTDDLRLRNYAPRTVSTYVAAIARFARHFGRSPECLGPAEVRTYQLHLLHEHASWSRFNQVVCALRFLYPGNRKILAYLRELEDETILCVNNLARTAQAVELDLSSFAGRVPINMIGGSRFPPIGQLTYLLTLPPYGVYWLLLAAEARLPDWHQPAPEPMPEFVTLVTRNGLRDLADPAVRKLLEEESLPAYLPKRRWFSGLRA